jgi:hypothetical protein
MKSLSRKKLITALTLCALALSGCLKAKETDRATYDAQRDEFRLVMVLENIDGGTGDMDYLGNILVNKDHLIAPLMPGDAFGYAPWFLRLEDHKTAKVSFVEPQKGDMQPIDAIAPLDTIAIHPGALFVQNNRLCYYHAVNVPGKTVDALLEQTRKDNFDPLKKAVKEELNRRAKGGKVHTWQQLTDQELTALKSNSGDHPIKPFMVMEAASLDKIVAASAKAQSGITRKGKDFQILVPLTATDRTGFLGLWDTWTKSAKEHPVDPGAKKDARSFTLNLPVEALAIVPTDDGVALSIDILKIYNILSESFAKYQESNPLFAPDSSPAREPASEVKYALSHNWPLQANLTTAQILKDFDAGTLQTFPSETLVKPGTGLKVQPKK